MRRGCVVRTMQTAVFGISYVGAVSAACLARVAGGGGGERNALLTLERLGLLLILRPFVARLLDEAPSRTRRSAQPSRTIVLEGTSSPREVSPDAA